MQDTVVTLTAQLKSTYSDVASKFLKGALLFEHACS